MPQDWEPHSNHAHFSFFKPLTAAGQSASKESGFIYLALLGIIALRIPGVKEDLYVWA